MREKYQKEMASIHVPAEVLQQTKRAMEEEAQRVGRQKNFRKVLPFTKISMVAAAAVLLLIIVPVGFRVTGEERAQDGSQSMPMHLAGQAEIEMQKIEAGEGENVDNKNWIEKLVDKIQEIFD